VVLSRFPGLLQEVLAGRHGTAEGTTESPVSLPARKDSPMITVDHLTKRYGTVTAVDGLSFEVGSGRVTGFLGPNGTGTTTTLRMLLGLVAPDGGTATIDGIRYRDLPHPAQTVGAALENDCSRPQRPRAPADRGHRGRDPRSGTALQRARPPAL
jgi:ABC-type glutathione transport system ATPase component